MHDRAFAGTRGISVHESSPNKNKTHRSTPRASLEHYGFKRDKVKFIILYIMISFYYHIRSMLN
jgi:hypothetical protein